MMHDLMATSYISFVCSRINVLLLCIKCAADTELNVKYLMNWMYKLFYPIYFSSNQKKHIAIRCSRIWFLFSTENLKPDASIRRTLGLLKVR